MWRGDPDRRGAGQFLEGAAFQTKPEIALPLIEEMRALNGSDTCVLAAADNADNKQLLNGLEALPRALVVAVRANFSVTRTWRADALVQRAHDVLRALTRQHRHTTAGDIDGKRTSPQLGRAVP
jgi:SRSO17 transposase